MAAPQQQTLGHLVWRVAVRCGFGAQGGATAAQRPILYEFVKTAQTQLIEQYSPSILHVYNDTDPGTLAVGQSLYDIPNDADPNDMHEIRLFTVDGDAAYPALTRGISNTQRANDERYRPTNYEIRRATTSQAQIEVWPPPDAAYPIVMEYDMREQTFEEADDRCTIHSELVFLHALTAAKSYYNQADAEGVSQQLTSMLNQLKFKQHRGRRYIRRGFSSADSGRPIPPRPRRV